MEILNSKAGSVVIQKYNDRCAYFSVDGVDLVRDFTSFITKFSFSMSENFIVNNCFNESSHLLAFGHDSEQSMAKITIVTFLFDRLCTQLGISTITGGLVRNITSAYKFGRVGVTGYKSGQFSCDNISVRGPITEIHVSCEDPDSNIVTVEISMLILEVNEDV
jgi:hypothetical protein